MKQHQTQSSSDKPNIRSYVLIAALILINVALLLVTARYMLLKQHVSVTDGQYFSENGIWVRLLGLIAGAFGMSSLELAHKVLPAVFIVCFVVIYAWLGIKLFSADERGRVHNVVMTLIFISLELLIFHVGYFSPKSLEAGVYLNPWQGSTIAGILLAPILMGILIAPSSIRKYIELSVTGILFFIVAGIDNWQRFILYKEGYSFVEKGWLLMLAVAGLITIFMRKKNGFVPIIVTTLIITVCMIPAPVGLIVSYAVAEVAAEAFYEKKTFWGAAVIYVIMAGVILAAGLFSGSRVSWNAAFGPVENSERIPQDLEDMNEWIMSEGDAEVPIFTSDEIESAFKQIGASGESRPENITGLWEESPMKGHDIEKAYDDIPESRIYVIIKNVTDDDIKLMSKKGLWIVKNFNSYNLYGR
ncbi:MAG: hypothetical protein J5517_00270 [Eubacterium sp.]|nr:hypothetical protein [Eubacterium sp.]